MWLYSLHIKALINELQHIVIGKSINKLYRNRHNNHIILSIGKFSEVIHLQFVPDPKSCRLGLIDDFNSKGKQDITILTPPFIKQRIIDISQINFDRIVKFTLADTKGKQFALYFNLIPSKRNILFSENDSLDIKWSLFKVKYKRIIFPKQLTLPSPSEVRENYIKKLIEEIPSLNAKELLADYIQGIDTMTASEFLRHINIEPKTGISALNEEQLNRLISETRELEQKIIYAVPLIKFKEGVPAYFYFSFHKPKADILSGEAKVFSSILRAIESFGSYIEKENNIKRLRSRLIKSTNNNIQKAEALTHKLKGELELYGNADLFRKYGDLLLINPNIDIRGKKGVRIEDIFESDKPMITIPVNPYKSIPDNAADYYKKHRKSQRGIKSAQKRNDLISKKLKSLYDLLSRIKAAKNEEELKSRIDDAFNLGIDINKEDLKARGKTPIKTFNFRAYEFDNGIKLYAGRDNKSNDQLTFQFSSKNDLWFHSQQSPGSHIILKRPHRNYEFPRDIIEKAASVAAYFSSARNSSIVPVVYTEVKYVRKPKNSTPGKAIYNKEKSVLVKPINPVDIPKLNSINPIDEI